MIIPPLQPDVPQDGPDAPAPRPTGPACLNCGTLLEARYCHVCGQRKQRLVVSLYAIVVELIEGVFDIESRLWRTLWPLFARPGLLTKSFMEGKRERYLPPVRLYLISSIIFFLLISMSPRNLLNEISEFINSMKGVETSEFALGEDSRFSTASIKELGRNFDQINVENNEPANSPGTPLSNDPDEGKTGSDDASAVTLGSREVIDVDSDPQLPEAEPVTTYTPNANASDSTEPNTGDAKNSDSALSNTIGDDDNAAPDDLEDFELATVCEELRDTNIVAFEFLRSPLYRGCISISTWGGFLDFLSDFIDDLPKTLFILLPLMAILNKFMYLFAGRYYVEHLLYYVHNYSFLFLFSVLLTGITKLATLAGIGTATSNILMPLGTLYVIYYFFKSMRVVYGQGFFFTLVKWLILNTLFFVLVLFVIVFFTLAAAAVHGI